MTKNNEEPTPRDRAAWFLLIARALREVGFGVIAIILPLYWHEQHISALEIGALFTVALLGSSLISLFIGRYVDHFGRRRLLMLSSFLWFVAAPFLLVTKEPLLLGVIIILGSISPTGKEVGLFLGIEQAMLSKLVKGHARTKTYAWFTLVGYTATAVGALIAALLGFELGHASEISTGLFRVVVLAYSAIALIQLILYAVVPNSVEQILNNSEAVNPQPRHHPTAQVRKVVRTLTALFTVDAFGGGLIVQGLLVYWFRVKFGFDLTQIGLLFFGTNLFSALSSLVAASISKRFGLLNTMVFTHLPSNILLALVPFAPTGLLAAVVLLARHMLSQMDVPTRQAYTMAIVDAEDRGYLAATTNGARSLGTGASPLIAGVFLSSTSLFAYPFVIAGGLKAAYDIVIYSIFRRVPTPYTETQ
ncbi:MFS transporter [Ferrimicrobium sp.]|uniref:MFS transporter n=1 Tax=Ferrimicrobium sp. TaxID=2926050 RepID=UPI0026249B31|nr:MFS transporter [Ferrimicrobium sp.]